jgi:hypothetical protein
MGPKDAALSRPASAVLTLSRLHTCRPVNDVYEEAASRAGPPSVPPSLQGQALAGAPLRSAALTGGGVWSLVRTGRGRGRGAAADGRQGRR